MPTVMLDHPGWFYAPDGRTHRVVTDDAHKLSLVTADHLAQGLFIDCSPVGPVGTRTVVGYFDPGELCGPLSLTAPLRALGTVSRLANPWLWDALGTAILGQFATPKQVRHLYTQLCRAYGRLVRTHVGEVSLLPRPEVLVGLGLEDFIDLQLRVRQPTLQLAASAYLDHGEGWSRFLSSDGKPVELVEAIAAVLPQLDRQTIRRAVADYSNDFTIYPVDSLLRSSVCRLSARHSWPVDNREFHTEWQAMTGDQQSAWTVLTLAAGTNCYLSASSQDESTNPDV
ncbi:hypothetical protein ABZ942_13285 [Nocardia sp. NPDC046473]|uniref:hypothetical protein n=1 Tax=Nocardia sp. NPDC046473 TaxID=3155733 RepID=UPI0033ECEDE7